MARVDPGVMAGYGASLSTRLQPSISSGAVTGAAVVGRIEHGRYSDTFQRPLSREHRHEARQCVPPCLMATAISCLGSGCSWEDPPPPPVAPVSARPVAALEPPIDTDVLSLLSLKIGKKPGGEVRAERQHKQLVGADIKFATATFKIFDKKGKEIGSSTATWTISRPDFMDFPGGNHAGRRSLREVRRVNRQVAANACP